MTARPMIRPLLLGTALVVPLSFAGAVQAQNADTACQDLLALLDAGLPETIQDREDDARTVAEANDAEQCLVVVTEIQTASQGAEGAQLAETEQATVRLEDEVVIQGQVFLETTPPQVELQEGQTEVMVSGGTPDVTVREGQGEILIRQAPPVIRLDMPQPTITIEQAAPEIIITMPAPGVDVANARPQVEVRQSQPQVRVTQTNPNVTLELSRAPEGSEGGVMVTDRATGQAYAQGEVMTVEPQVALTQSDPQIVYQDGEQQANVQVERAQPTVRFEQADPQIEVTSTGEPQVQFTQMGEPQITFQEAEGEQAAATEAQPAAQPMAEPAAGVDANAQPVEGAVPLEGAEIDTVAPVEGDAAAVQPVEGAAVTANDPAMAPVMAGPMIEREGYEVVDYNELTADDLEDARVYGINDESVGDIGELILNPEGRIEAAVIDVGGFLGIGERQVRVGFDQLTILRQAGTDDVRIYIDSTEERLEELPEYEQ